MAFAVFCYWLHFCILCCAICFKVVVEIFSALSVYINGACF